MHRLRRMFNPERSEPRLLDARCTEEEKATILDVDYERSRIQIKATSRMERRYRARACAKEPWTIEWLEREVRPGDALYDIGANVGVYSIIGAKLLRNRGAVIAFEPGYASYARLCENIALNGVPGLVVPFPLPLWSEAGIVSFKYRSLEPGQSRHRMWRNERSLSGEHEDGGDNVHPVVAVTLDQAIEVLKIPPPTLIKLDVDGAELHVLTGALRTLARPNLRSLLIEIERKQTDAVVSLLAESGLSLTERHERAPTRPVWYGVFRRNECA
jgi:FkbM family methyltransferase